MANQEAKKNRANSLLESYLGVNTKEFLEEYLKENSMEAINEEKYISYLSNIAILEQRGQDIYNINQEGVFKQFYNFLQNSIIYSRAQHSLSKSQDVRNLTTLVSRDLFNKMLQGEADRKILTGKKYYDSKSETTFDILLNMRDIKELPNMNNKEIPVVPYFNSSEIRKPQRYLLSINKQFPDVDKVFMRLRRESPRLFRLIKTSFNETNPKRKMFVPGSYIFLDNKD